MNKLNFPVAATSIALCAAAAAFAGEPTFGDLTVYGRINLTLEHATACRVEQHLAVQSGRARKAA